LYLEVDSAAAVFAVVIVTGIDFSCIMMLSRYMRHNDTPHVNLNANRYLWTMREFSGLSSHA